MEKPGKYLRTGNRIVNLGSKRGSFRRVWTLLAAAALLIPTIIATAKGAGILVVTGPGIDGEILIEDQAGMANVEKAGFWEVSRSVDIPSGLGDGYHISFFFTTNSSEEPWMELEYYPGPGDELGYVKMIRNPNSGSMVPEGRYFQFQQSADRALRDILKENGVPLEPAFGLKAMDKDRPGQPQPADVSAVTSSSASVEAQPQAPTGMPAGLPWAVAGLAALAVGLGVLRRLLPRPLSHRR